MELKASFLGDPKALTKFYKEYKNKPPDVVKKLTFEMGKQTGSNLIKQHQISGNNFEKLLGLFDILLKDKSLHEITSYKNGIRVKIEGFCLITHKTTSLEIPGEWLCSNVGWPFFHGLGASAFPNVRFESVHCRNQGDPYCLLAYLVPYY